MKHSPSGCKYTAGPVFYGNLAGKKMGKGRFRLWYYVTS